MTNASATTRTVVEHRFTVPAPEPWGATWDDFSVAKAWAENKAGELGISTNSADWSRIHVTNEAIVIVLVEKRPEEDA